MDSDSQRVAAEAELHRQTLAKVAEYLASQREAVIDQWLMAVRRDPEIAAADRLTHQQLLDHLPQIYEECCQFLRTRNASVLVQEAKADAQTHGEIRWADGYQIDELLRELEIFRGILNGTLLRFSDIDLRFRGPIVVAISSALQQFFGEVTVHSVAQYASEQQRVIKAYTDQIESINLELSRANNRLEQTLAERQRLIAVVVQEVRGFLLSLKPAGPDPPQPRASHNELTSDRASESEELLVQLLDQATLIVSREPLSPTLIDLPALHDELLQMYRSVAYGKGLAVVGSCSGSLKGVKADRRRLKQVASSLLSNAIRSTSEGHVSLTFATRDQNRWVIQVSDSGPGLDDSIAGVLAGSAPVAAEIPNPGIALTMAKDLVNLLGGSLQVITKTGSGTVVEVVLPIDSES